MTANIQISTSNSIHNLSQPLLVDEANYADQDTIYVNNNNDTNIYNKQPPIKSKIKHLDDITIDTTTLPTTKQLQQLLYISLPVIATNLIQYCISFASIIFCGHLGSNELSGMSLGIIYCSITGIAFTTGLTQALDTLIPQSYGCKHYNECGYHLYRGVVIITTVTIPVMYTWLYHTTDVLLYLNQPYDIVTFADQWATITAYALYAQLFIELIKRFLQGQFILWINVVMSIVASTLNIYFNYLFVYKYDLSVIGSAYANVLATWSALLTQIICIISIIYYQSKQQINDSTVDKTIKLINTLPKPSLSILFNITSIIIWLRLGISAGISQFIEQSCFMGGSIIIGWLGPMQLAIHSIYQQTSGLWYSITNGLAMSTATLVGNSLGLGYTQQAINYIKLSLYVVICYSTIVCGLFTMIMNNEWPHVFTNDMSLIIYTGQSMSVLWLYGILDSTKTILVAVLRSIGRPGLTVISNTVSCLCICYPLAIQLMFINQQSYGIVGWWLSLTVAWLINTIIYTTFLYRLDWIKETKYILMQHIHNKKATMIHIDNSSLSSVSNNTNFNKNKLHTCNSEHDIDTVTATPRLRHINPINYTTKVNDISINSPTKIV